MAFPGTYNFRYYKGDTFQFRIYPKNAAGAPFDLSGYDDANGAQFTIANARGPAGFVSRAICSAIISSDKTFIECTIAPEIGITLDVSITYQYDVEISKSDTSSGEQVTETYTLLNGTISVTDHITGATPPEEVG
jgi:hypothetical protein